MRNLRLVVEYDGSQFFGFQRQASRRTVQGDLERSLTRLLAEKIEIVGAGRTDAGVHATGQVVNFKCENSLPIERAAMVFNAALPDDIAVRKVDEVALDFHARRSARSRAYRYTVLNCPLRSARLGRFCGWESEPLDCAMMNEALQPLLGEHDFAAFQAAGSPAKSTYRRLLRAQCRRVGDLVCIGLEADAFLYQMARITVASLLLIGKGDRPAEWLGELLAGRDRRLAPPPASPSGLCLVKVKY
jgi:tRNA pseudouridine38-40 synthase